MKKELWDNIKSIHEDKADHIPREEQARIIIDGYQEVLDDSKLIASLEGRGDVFIAGGKGLLGAGALWFLIGKLSMFAARKVRDQYDPN